MIACGSTPQSQVLGSHSDHHGSCYGLAGENGGAGSLRHSIVGAIAGFSLSLNGIILRAGVKFSSRLNVSGWRMARISESELENNKRASFIESQLFNSLNIVAG